MIDLIAQATNAAMPEWAAPLGILSTIFLGLFAADKVPYHLRKRRNGGGGDDGGNGKPCCAAHSSVRRELDNHDKLLEDRRQDAIRQYDLLEKIRDDSSSTRVGVATIRADVTHIKGRLDRIEDRAMNGAQKT